jgi:hypothetical protein
LFGNADNFAGTIRFTQKTRGTASESFVQTVPPGGVELGIVFLDIKNAAVGDTFTLYIKKDNPQPTGGNTNTNVLDGGVTFDTIPVPEPGAASLFLAGAALLFRRRSMAILKPGTEELVQHHAEQIPVVKEST